MSRPDPHRRRRALVVSILMALALAPVPAWAAGPGESLQWALDHIGARTVWTVANAQGRGQVVAVVDSGIDEEHEDLGGALAGTANCIGSNGSAGRCRPGDAADDDGHGTHVAGVVAARRNDVGVAGVAPEAKVLAIRSLSHTCTGTTCTATGDGADVDGSIRYAVEQGAGVVNLSLGSAAGAVLGSGFAKAVSDAWAAGVIVVIAAGDDVASNQLYASLPAIVVTGLTRDDTPATYTNAHGIGRAMWGISAPGGEVGDTAQTCRANGTPLGILSTYTAANRHDQYACLSGTSMAAPHVAGAAAILRGLGLTAPQAVEQLLSTARDLGAPGRDTTYGSGLLDVAKAVGAPPPTVRPTVTARPATPGTTARPAATTTTSTTAAPTTTVTTPGASTADPTSSTTAPNGPTSFALGPDRPSSSGSKTPAGAVAGGLVMAMVGVHGAAAWQRRATRATAV